jgi:hypothetical protein
MNRIYFTKDLMEHLIHNPEFGSDEELPTLVVFESSCDG